MREHGAIGSCDHEPSPARILTQTVGMSVDVVTEITIDRPVSVVAAYSMDPSNAPEWYSNIKSVEWGTPPPARIGSKVAFVATFLGRRLAYTYELVEIVPDEHLVMRTAQGPFPMETTYRWASTGDDGTRMTLRNRGEPAGFSRVVAPFIAGAMRRANRRDLANLARILEAAPDETTSSAQRRMPRTDHRPPEREERGPRVTPLDGQGTACGGCR
jgi:uncharacterized membrane protein